MSKPAGRNNAKIITRPQGGGNKLQGLAPVCTSFYIAQSTGQSYYTETGDGRNRNLVLCVNQLGGIGRHRSQFRPNADGNRGTFCIKPLLSVFGYDPNYIENSNSRSHIGIYVNKLNTELLVNDFGFLYGAYLYELSANNLNINFGGTQLDMCSNTQIEYVNYPNTNFGIFLITNRILGKVFSDETYEYLHSLKAINTINDESQNNGIYNLLSGYNFTITTKSNPVKSLTFNSLNNENYYTLLKNNNWYNFLN